VITWRVDSTKLDKQFADDVDALLSDDPGNWVVTYGRRTREEQAALYAKYLKGGPRAAPPGESAHEAGFAVDVTLVVGNHDDWNYKDSNWRRLVHRIHMHPRLHSLDDIGDTDHIEAVNWRLLAHKQTATIT
jgi:hypothetical protein